MHNQPSNAWKHHEECGNYARFSGPLPKPSLSENIPVKNLAPPTQKSNYIDPKEGTDA